MNLGESLREQDQYHQIQKQQYKISMEERKHILQGLAFAEMLGRVSHIDVKRTLNIYIIYNSYIER